MKQQDPEWDDVIIPDSPYAVQKYVEPPESFPLDSPINVTAMAIKWLLWAKYINHRYRTLPVFRATGQHWILWTIFLTEVCALASPFFSQLDLSLYVFYGKKGWRRPKYRLVGDAAPTIDVFITTCGEDISVIIGTVLAAASQDYPRNKYRVFVLDDAGSAELEAAIAAYNDHKPNKIAANVFYLSRIESPGGRHCFKSGNLRFGFAESTKTGYISEYVAALDVDAIAERDWLRRTVPHLILNENIALATAAQSYYNVPDYDFLGVGNPAFNKWVAPLRDNLGNSTCYGSGYVLRRSALDAVGGWPLVPVGEDIYFGFLLAGQGWEIASCRDILQYTLAPESLDALFKQRMRWVSGDLNLAWAFRFFLPGLDPASRRRVPQILSGLLSCLWLHRAALDSVYIVLTPILLCILHPRNVINISENCALRRVYFASIVADKLFYVLLSGRPNGLTNSLIWETPYKAVAMLRFYLPNTVPSFHPTGTVKSSVNECSSRRRLPLWQRLKSWRMLAYSLYIFCASFALISFLYRLELERRTGPVFPSPYFSGALLWLLECIFKMSIPVRYMIWPPTIPEREELLEKDELGVLRPKSRPYRAPSTTIPYLDVLQLAVVAFVGWRECR